MQPNPLSFVLFVALLGAQPALAAGAADGHSHAKNSPIGVAGKAAKATRTVRVEMTDAMRFVPASVDVARGETVRFLVSNTGKLKHEFVLGTEQELKEHYEVMKKFPEMEHDDPNMVTVAPGKTGEVVWRFTKAGRVDIGCLQPGHYDAGMKGVVRVGGTRVGSAGAGASLAFVQATPEPRAMTDAEVRKIDPATSKITLRHGEIRNLDMPAMTMVFQVKDPLMLDKVKAGDKVRFTAEKLNGAFTVTSIEATK